MTGNIRKFLLVKNQKKTLLYCWDVKKNIKSQIDLKKKNFFLIGYKTSKYSIDDEFISIEIDKKISIVNDIFGSQPLYHYKNSNKEIFSNSIDEIFKFSKDITISKKEIYKYFSFGYLPFSQKTIYNNVRLVQSNSKIEITKKIQISTIAINLFKKKKVNIQKGEKDFLELFEKKIDTSKLNKSALCLTAGYDSLLSLIYAKKMTLATFGSSKSLDIIGAKRRKKKFAYNQKHFIYNIKNHALKDRDFIEYAGLLGGFANLSSIQYLFFINYLKKKKIHYLYFSDHFETARRNFKNINDLKNKYLTPSNIVEKYFKKKKIYYLLKKNFVREINSKYKTNRMNNFYFYDRFIKGNFWKNQICSNLGIIRISLPLDFKFINNNFNLLKKNNKNNFFFNLFPNNKNIKDELNFTEKSYTINSETKDVSAVNSLSILNLHKKYFIKVINSKYSKQFYNYFNLDLMKKSIKETNYIKKEEWFLLRFLSLIIFANKHKIKVK